MNKTETTVTQSLNELLDVYEVECMNLREWLGENFDKTVSRPAIDLAKRLEKELKNLRVTACAVDSEKFPNQRRQ